MKPLYLLISFDDTGSMYSVRAEVRRKIEFLIRELRTIRSELYVCIIIHNDYCNEDTIQKSTWMTDIETIVRFIKRNSSCGGGDSDECYELVLKEIADMTWGSEEADRVAILIGDAEPHSVGYKIGWETAREKYGNTVQWDWKTEAGRCNDRNVKLYPIQALGSRRSAYFYNGLASIFGTPKLDLSQFAHIVQYLSAIVYHESGQLDVYEKSQPEFRTNLSLRDMFAKLRGGILPSTREHEYADTMWADLGSRFQVMEVDEARKISDFVKERGMTFRTGRGFYQLVGPEVVQEYKDVVLVDKGTGAVIFDKYRCRKMMGLPYGERGKINPRNLDISHRYDIFVQSTSNNRKLDPGTKFLYELEHR